MPVLILAGGLATRLRPVTEKIPKSLVEVNGEPFLAHQLRLVAANGIREVVMSVGYRGEMIEEFAGSGSAFGLRVRYVYDGPVLLGTGGAIRKALAPLGGGAFFTLYGDSYLTCDFQAAGAHFLASGKSGLMTVFENRGLWDTSNVVFRDGELLVYDKKNRSPEMHHIDYGLGAFHSRVFESLPEGQPADLATVYQQLLAAGDLDAYEVPERFYEIGTPEGIRETEEFLKR